MDSKIGYVKEQLVLYREIKENGSRYDGFRVGIWLLNKQNWKSNF